MVYIIFNTRNALFALSKKLTAKGIDHSVVSTPKHMGRTCSLSIKMQQSDHQKAKAIINQAMGDIYAVKKG
ncbi:MAG: putative Se/S carrier-like protein [Bacillota bacterium]